MTKRQKIRPHDEWCQEVVGEVRVVEADLVQNLTRVGWDVVSVHMTDTVLRQELGGGFNTGPMLDKEGRPTIVSVPVFVMRRGRDESVQEADEAVNRAQVQAANATKACEEERQRTQQALLQVEKLKKDAAEREAAAEKALKQAEENWRARYDRDVALMLSALAEQSVQEHRAVEALARLGNPEQVLDWLRARIQAKKKKEVA